MDILRITSPHNPRIKAAARLRDHRARQQQGRIIIDGWREIGIAHQSGIAFIEVYFCAEQRPEQVAKLREYASGGTTLFEVPDSILEKIAFGERNEGVVAVAAAPQRSLPQLESSPAPLVVVLEDVEKPGNVGAILRTASAAGVDALVTVGQATDLNNPNTIRASLGTVFSVPCCTANVTEVQSWLRRHQLQICAAKVDASETLFDYDFTRGTAIVLGSEATGLSASWSADDVQSVRIPMQGAADSLNVSVSAAILMYEAVRQRWKKSGFEGVSNGM